MSILKHVCDLGFDWLTSGSSYANVHLFNHVGSHTIDYTSSSPEDHVALLDKMRADLSRLKLEYTVKVSRRFAQQWAGWLEGPGNQGEGSTLVFTSSTLDLLQSARTRAEANHIVLNLFATFFHELTYILFNFVCLDLYGVLCVLTALYG